MRSSVSPHVIDEMIRWLSDRARPRGMGEHHAESSAGDSVPTSSKPRIRDSRKTASCSSRDEGQ